MKIVPVLSDITIWMLKNGLLTFDCGIELPLQQMCEYCDELQCNYYKWLHFQKKLSEKYSTIQEINQ